MTFAILAAGESLRLKREGINLPKPLIELSGEMMIDRLVRIARDNNFSKVVCIINEQEELLKKYLSKKDYGIRFKLIVKSTPSSMHSFFELSSYLRKDYFCLTTADTVFDEREFRSFIEYCKSNNHFDGILSITNFIDDEKPLCVKVKSDNTITLFSDFQNEYNWATGGVYFFFPVIFNEMQNALSSNIERLRNYFRLLLKKSYKLGAFRFSKIIDLDHLKDLILAEEYIKQMKDRKTSISKSKIVNSEEGVK